jgi:hypothetical protein
MLATSPALAQGDKAAAETLFQAGVALMTEGKYAEACPKFLESQRADPSSGTLLNLASCYEKTGKTASAWATYKEAAVLARSLGQTDREATAHTRIAALEPTLSKLRIDTGDLPGLVIKRDGLDIGRGSLGVPIAIDPGEHTITASAPGYEDWSVTVAVGTDADMKAITVPPLRKKVISSSQNGYGDQSGSASGSTLRTVGFIVGGVGIGAIGAGAVLCGLAIHDQNEADPLCPNKLCSAEGQNLVNEATDKAIIGTIGLSVGVAAVGAGAVMIFLLNPPKSTTEPTPSSPSATMRIVPSIGREGGSLTLLGRF